MTTTLAPLAIIDPDGAVVELPDEARAIAVDDAERIFGLAQTYITRLRRIKDIAQAAIEQAWTGRGQREGILGGEHYVLEAKPGAWTYSDALYDALRPFVGKVLTEDELQLASGHTVIPEHVQVVPETTQYGWSTAKVDALARRSAEVRRIVDEYRERDEGTPKLARKAMR